VEKWGEQCRHGAIGFDNGASTLARLSDVRVDKAQEIGVGKKRLMLGRPEPPVELKLCGERAPRLVEEVLDARQGRDFITRSRRVYDPHGGAEQRLKGSGSVAVDKVTKHPGKGRLVRNSAQHLKGPSGPLLADPLYVQNDFGLSR
jgi:hypothetical protein